MKRFLETYQFECLTKNFGQKYNFLEPKKQKFICFENENGEKYFKISFQLYELVNQTIFQKHYNIIFLYVMILQHGTKAVWAFFLNSQL